MLRTCKGLGWSFLSLRLILLLAVGANPAIASDSEIIRKAADHYLNSGQPLSTDARALYSDMASSMPPRMEVKYYDPSIFKKGPQIVDLRSPDTEMPDPYTVGHIPGAVRIPWQKIAEWRHLKDLPKGRRIVVYSGTGQTGGQIAAILNVLGYNALNLTWGITAWTTDKDAAPGRYERFRDTVWSSGGSFRTVTRIDPPTETYSLPAIEKTASSENFTAILTASRRYLNDPEKCLTVSAPEIYYAMHSAARRRQRYGSEEKPLNPYVFPFIVDVRDEEAYRLGHIENSLHIRFQDLFKKENLRRLPPDRQIVLYCETGHRSSHAVALLNMLGYDAASLKWGITSWSLSLPGRDVAPGRYAEQRDCIDYEVVRGFEPSFPCPG
jgi:rhodanese-related sulfurtransferase